MRIGTWNLAGRWDDRHRELLLAADCDVWLLTEVNERLAFDGYSMHLGEMQMAARRRWAAVLGRNTLKPLPDPHPASAAALMDGVTFCSTILPWRGCRSRPPWLGERHADKTAAAVDELVRKLPDERLVWGGDWNHALSGREWSGSAEGRSHILDAVDRLELQVPTARLPHRIDGLLSIDHIAVTTDADEGRAERIRAGGLSDHDAYVVDLAGKEPAKT